jgi:hypothetical protein
MLNPTSSPKTNGVAFVGFPGPSSVLLVHQCLSSSHSSLGRPYAARLVSRFPTSFTAPSACPQPGWLRNAGHAKEVAPVVPASSRRQAVVPVAQILTSTAADALRDVPEPVLRAVERLARQPRVTVPDVAAAAGVDVLAAQDAMVTLASVTGAAIDVSEDGELAYRFPRDVRQVLRRKSFRAALRMAWDKAFPVLFGVVRVAFGGFLIISIVITFLAILAISTSGRSDDDRNGRSSRSGGGGMIFGPRLFGPDIFDVMFYSRRMRGYNEYGKGAINRGKPDQMSFLESVYSFVFGDGDPNEDLLQSKRWRKVAAVIRSNNGAVIAEQLAPFLDLPSDYFRKRNARSAGIVDESFMLPVLQRFHGHPEVTDDGHLIYIFPDFGLTGSNRGLGATVDLAGASANAAVRESELTLSNASTGQQLIAGGLGVLNLVGALTLGSMLSGVVPVGHDAAVFLSFVRGIYPALFLYAVSFIVFPAARYLRQRKINGEIRSRNNAREKAALELLRPSTDLRLKLREADKRAQESRIVGSESVVYSTDKDMLDQPALERQASSDFDRRLSERSRDNVSAVGEDDDVM